MRIDWQIMAVSALDSDSADSGLDFVWQVYDLFSGGYFFAIKEPEDERKYSADPDLLFEINGTGKQFWVDCIYRPSFERNGNLDVYYADEAKRRLSYYEVLEDPVFIAITSTTPKCTNCGGPMKLVHGKYSIFYGCMSFPRCSGFTIKFREEVLY
ncbi:MAG: topoisomerase DNA-binding C4 zinc finger domain-containing protein [Lachnospiraceae bacterium]|nr:topoisomerase DNA-binding C4 zinc finger domain-containing protein [Lachnospiraceae bacterium]